MKHISRMHIADVFERILLVTAVVFLAAFGCSSPAFDVLITNATIIDGTGKPGFTGDIGIKDGKITEIGSLAGQTAARTIDAAGRVTAPGFIDMMGGGSLVLLRDPASAESKLRQGITTMMAGEGSSVAPRDPREPFPENIRFMWTTYEDYLRIMDEKRIALNVIHNVGAAQVRDIVLGDIDVDPTPGQLDEMKQLVEQAMKDGAVGLSSALIYPPGSYAKTGELIELAKVAAKYGGVYFTHVRNESGGVVEAIQEAITIGKEANIPVHIYHIKAAGQDNWPLMEKALKQIEEARSSGLEVTADVYPYIRNGIGLGSFIHPRHYAEGRAALLRTLNDPEVKRRLRREIETTSDWENWYRHVGNNWDNVLISNVGTADESLAGLSIQQVAEKMNMNVWDTFFDLVVRRVGVNPKSMNEEQKHQAMRAPFVCFDCDASPTNPEAVAASHPRAFGTFPRILAKYVREEKVISIEEAVRKMTSLPAQILRLDDRGTIAPGKVADIVIFDPDKIQDKATFTEPLLYSEGVDFLIVGGEPVIDDGNVTGALPGEAIRHKDSR